MASHSLGRPGCPTCSSSASETSYLYHRNGTAGSTLLESMGIKGFPPCVCAALLVKRGVYILHGSDSFCLFLLRACSVRVLPSSSDCRFRMFPDSCCLKGQIISWRSPVPRSSHTNDVYVCVCLCVCVCAWPDPSTSAPSTDRHERFSAFNRCVKPHMQNGAWRTAARPHLVLHLGQKKHYKNR